MKWLLIISPLLFLGCGDENNYYREREPVACYYSSLKQCYGCEYETDDVIYFRCRR